MLIVVDRQEAVPVGDDPDAVEPRADTLTNPWVL